MANTDILATATLHGKQQPPLLTVTGTKHTPNRDDKVIVTKADPQGINETILLLDLKVDYVDGPKKMTPKPFNYEDSSKDVGEYKQVTITDIDDTLNSITIDVHYLG